MPETFPPAQSALNLRLLLAGGGAVMCAALGVLTWRAFGLPPALLLFLLALGAVVNVVVLLRRRSQRASAHRHSDHRHDSLFE